jgi:excisionase family DNA binding protein
VTGGLLTIDEAAEQVGVSTATLRQWVVRGHLEPLRRGTKPLVFHAADVWRCARERLPRRERERISELARRWHDTP